MLLVIAQAIVILASSGLNNSTKPVSVNASDTELEGISTVNSDLKEVMKSINGINAEPVDTTPVKPSIQKKAIAGDLKSVQANKKLTVITKKTGTINKELNATKNIKDLTETKPDYIKYDKNGDSLSEATEKWSCVYDTATGLMWEVKSQQDALRNSNNLYSWYDPTRKNKPGQQDGGRCEGSSDCDTNAYITALNKSNYCGHNDWKLPTREQMQTLVNLKNAKDEVKIDQRYFPQTLPSWYWTSSDEGNDDEFAWYVLFRNGFALSDLKERPKHIRLVRIVESDLKSN